MGGDYEADEVIYETSTERVIERRPESSAYPTWVQRLGRMFHLSRREIVSRSGERTHFRVTYRADEGPGDAAVRRR